jgi:hypothetical protein
MDQIFTSQFWHDQWAVVARALWAVIPLLLIAFFVGRKWKRPRNDGAIRQLRERLQYLNERLRYMVDREQDLRRAKDELEEEYKELKVQLASNAPNKEGLLAAAVRMEKILTKLSASANALEGPSAEDLAPLVTKISPFSGTKFDVGGSGKSDRALEDFNWLVEPALSKAGWVHIDWIRDTNGDTFQMTPWSTGTKRHYGVVTGAVNIVVQAAMPGDKNAAAEALVSALNEIGIPATKENANNTNRNRNTVHILVGLRQ